jgi:hypothetical protein
MVVTMSAGNEHVLPDSRLRDRNLGTVMGDWLLPSGETVRIEASPVHCANCGLFLTYVPKDNTSSTFFLCRKCFERHGVVPGTHATPEDEFNRKLEAEMAERFGRTMTAEELVAAEQLGQLGSGLELLARESPYPVPEKP